MGDQLTNVEMGDGWIRPRHGLQLLSCQGNPATSCVTRIAWVTPHACVPLILRARFPKLFSVVCESFSTLAGLRRRISTGRQ